MRTSLTVAGLTVGLVLVGCDPVPSPLPSSPPVVADEGADEGVLAVDLEPVDGVLIEGFALTLHYIDAEGNQVGEAEWSETVPPGSTIDDHYRHVHDQEVPAGAVTLRSWMRLSPGGPLPPASGPGCATPVNVGADDRARVTVLFGPDPHSGDCAAVAAATRQADQLLGMPRGLPAPGFVGLDEAEATTTASDRDWTTRVVARNGKPHPVTQDYVPTRVNLVIDQDVVLAAARG
jgi:hypothetical protein